MKAVNERDLEGYVGGFIGIEVAGEVDPAELDQERESEGYDRPGELPVTVQFMRPPDDDEEDAEDDDLDYFSDDDVEDDEFSDDLDDEDEDDDTDDDM